MKVAILVQRAFADKFEPQTLVNSFKYYRWDTSLLNVEDIYINLSNEIPKVIHKDLGDLSNFDVVLVREVFSKMSHVLAIINALKNQNVLVIDNNLSKVKFLANKLKESILIKNAGLPFPKSFYAIDIDTYLNCLPQIKSEIGYPLLLKKINAGKGFGIEKIENEQELIKRLKEINEIEPNKELKKYMVQEFLNLKADYRILVIGGVVLGAMQRIPKQGEFRANFSLGGTVKAVQLTEQMREIALKAIESNNADFAGVDLVYTTDNKPYLLEINRTPGFKGFMQAQNIDVPKYFIKYIEDKLKDNR